MKKIPASIVKYILENRVGVFAIEMEDGSPHAATLHFAYDKVNHVFLFETNKSYRKAVPLLLNKKVRGAFVIGVDERNMKTLQINGILRLLKPAQIKNFTKIYFKKFPEKESRLLETNSNDIMFALEVKWWRFTDWTGNKGKRVFSS